MKIVLFCHPQFVRSQSMPRFARMLKSSYEHRGHTVEIWSPRARFFRLLSGCRFAKWGGYLDQYVLFPVWVRKMLKSTSADTLFVFCDQALGPWVPLVKNRPHVVHVHDLLALRSALGDIKENPTSISGRIYQRYIRHGFQQARHFISISRKTRDDLHRFSRITALTSEVVYNGLNFPYTRLEADDAGNILRTAGFPIAPRGALLHVGGGQWYKNLRGVVSIYTQYANQVPEPLPLWCISPAPNAEVRLALTKVPKNGRVLFFSNLDNCTMQAVYSISCALLFPSLAEGFGWPLVEALACGCPVITTSEPPMTEVAGEAAHYLARLKFGEDIDAWAAIGATILREMVSKGDSERARLAEFTRSWQGRFDADRSIDAYLSIYKKIFGSI